MSDTIATLLTEHGRRAQCRHWLRSMGVTLWSDWDITDPDGLETAVEWFLDQIDDFQRHVERLAASPPTSSMVMLSDVEIEDMRNRGLISDTEEVWNPERRTV